MITYRHVVTALFSAGLLAGLTLGVLYAVDRWPWSPWRRWRPWHRWDRGTEVVTGLIAIVILSYGSGVLAIIGGAPIDAPRTVLGWIGSIVLRFLAVGYLWRLVVIYLTPGRSMRRDEANRR
jgi:hypothetical protein